MDGIEDAAWWIANRHHSPALYRWPGEQPPLPYATWDSAEDESDYLTYAIAGQLPLDVPTAADLESAVPRPVTWPWDQLELPVIVNGKPFTLVLSPESVLKLKQALSL